MSKSVCDQVAKVGEEVIPIEGKGGGAVVVGPATMKRMMPVEPQ